MRLWKDLVEEQDPSRRSWVPVASHPQVNWAKTPGEEIPRERTSRSAMDETCDAEYA